MLELLFAGGCVSLPFLVMPIEWGENPRVQPWIERLIIGTVAVWLLLFLITASEVVHGS